MIDWQVREIQKELTRIRNLLSICAVNDYGASEFKKSVEIKVSGVKGSFKYEVSRSEIEQFLTKVADLCTCAMAELDAEQ